MQTYLQFTHDILSTLYSRSHLGQFHPVTNRIVYYRCIGSCRTGYRCAADAGCEVLVQRILSQSVTVFIVEAIALTCTVCSGYLVCNNVGRICTCRCDNRIQSACSNCCDGLTSNILDCEGSSVCTCCGDGILISHCTNQRYGILGCCCYFRGIACICNSGDGYSDVDTGILQRVDDLVLSRTACVSLEGNLRCQTVCACCHNYAAGRIACNCPITVGIAFYRSLITLQQISFIELCCLGYTIDFCDELFDLSVDGFTVRFGLCAVSCFN